MWELYHTVDCGAPLFLIMSPSQQELFAVALVEDFDSIMRVLAAVDVAKAQTRKEKDRRMIMDAVATGS